jgi:tetratricopeptide (TPR) repeat protein
MGRFEDAQTVLTPFVPTLAEQPAAIRESAHFTLGEIDQASGRLESAIAHYEASVEAAQQMRPSLRRGQAECAVQIAVCLRTLGRRGEASARLESALRERRDEGLPLDATDGSLAYGLGEGYLTDEDLPRAREAYELALAATAPTVPADHPRLIPARTGLLRVAVIQQDFDGARKHMAHIRATRLSSFSPAVLSMIDFLEAQILWESGDDRPRAVQLARRALQTLREEPGRQGGNVPLIERWIEART